MITAIYNRWFLQLAIFESAMPSLAKNFNICTERVETNLMDLHESLVFFYIL